MTSEMKYDFVNEIVAKQEGKKTEEASAGFKLGYAVGVLGVGLIFLAAEIGALCLAAFLFGVTLTFWQALAVILIYKYVLFQINTSISS